MGSDYQTTQSHFLVAETLCCILQFVFVCIVSMFAKKCYSVLNNVQLIVCIYIYFSL